VRSFQVVAVVSLITVRLASAEDRLAEIERSLDEQYSSIRTAEVEFRVLYNVPTKGKVPQRCLDEATSWEWLLSDSKKLIKQHPHHSPNGQISLTWRSFDGRQAYEMWCWQTDGARPDTIRITPVINQNYFGEAAPAWMLGLHLGGCDTPVLDWLKRRSPQTVRDLGVESIDGHDCQKVEFDNVPSKGKYLTRAFVWFDAEADWLPRRIACWPLRCFELARKQLELRAENMEPIRMSLEPGESCAGHDVQSFMQVNDVLLGRPRWFPQKARIALDDTLATVFEIESAVMNQPIDDTRFVPLPVAGTQVEDHVTSNTPRYSVHGGNEGLVVRRVFSRAQAIDKPSEPQPSASKRVLTPQTTKPLVFASPDARPQRPGWWWPVLATATLLASLMWFRKWMASRS